MPSVEQQGSSLQQSSPLPTACSTSITADSKKVRFSSQSRSVVISQHLDERTHCHRIRQWCEKHRFSRAITLLTCCTGGCQRRQKERDEHDSGTVAKSESSTPLIAVAEEKGDSGATGRPSEVPEDIETKGSSSVTTAQVECHTVPDNTESGGMPREIESGRDQPAEPSVSDVGSQPVIMAAAITAEKQTQTEDKEQKISLFMDTPAFLTGKLEKISELGMLGGLEKLDRNKLEKIESTVLGLGFLLEDVSNLAESEVSISAELNKLKQTVGYCEKILAYNEHELNDYLKRDVKDITDELIAQRKKQLIEFYKNSSDRISYLEDKLIKNQEDLEKKRLACMLIYRRRVDDDSEPLVECEVEDEQPSSQPVELTTNKTGAASAEPDPSTLPQDDSAASMAQPVAASSIGLPDNSKTQDELEKTLNQIAKLERTIAAMESHWNKAGTELSSFRGDLDKLDSEYTTNMEFYSTNLGRDEEMLTSMAGLRSSIEDTGGQMADLRKRIILKTQQLKNLRERATVLKSALTSEQQMMKEKVPKVSFDVKDTSSPVTTAVAETVTESTQTERCKQEEKNTQTEEETKT